MLLPVKAHAQRRHSNTHSIPCLEAHSLAHLHLLQWSAKYKISDGGRKNTLQQTVNEGQLCLTCTNLPLQVTINIYLSIYIYIYIYTEQHARRRNEICHVTPFTIPIECMLYFTCYYTCTHGPSKCNNCNDKLIDIKHAKRSVQNFLNIHHSKCTHE